MSPFDEAVLTVVQSHVGKESGLSVREIMGEIDQTGDSYPVRASVKRLIERHGFPIGAHPDFGVFMLSDEDEINLVVKNLEARSKSITTRVDRLKEAFRVAVEANSSW